jgi:hypothetical protein
MPYITYNRPISKVGFRQMNQTSPARAAALSGIGTLGDDTATLATIGFDPSQIAQIVSAHNSGALSDAGYQQLVSGTVDPSQLAAFLDADLGAPETTSLIPGVPNWELTAFAAAAVLLLVVGSMRR